MAVVDNKESDKVKVVKNESNQVKVVKKELDQIKSVGKDRVGEGICDVFKDDNESSNNTENVTMREEICNVLKEKRTEEKKQGNGKGEKARRVQGI